MPIINKLCLKVIVWIEIVLNLSGIDDMADGSEFILSSKINFDEISMIEIDKGLPEKRFISA